MCDQRLVCVDIETTGLGWTDKILSVAASWHNGDGSIHSQTWLLNAQDLFHTAVPVTQIRSELAPILAQADLIVGHNFTFDLSRLFKYGIVTPDDVRGKLFDTQLVARMTGPHDYHSLESLCGEYKIGDDSWRSMKANRKNMTKVGVENLIIYNAQDTTNNLLLAERLYDHGKTIYDPAFLISESEFVRVTAEMQWLGIGLDADKLYERIKQIRIKRRDLLTNYLWKNKIEGPMHRVGLINWLTDQGFREFRYTDNGNITVDEAAIDQMIATLLEPFPPVLDTNGFSIDHELYYDARKRRVERNAPESVKRIVDLLDAVLACRGYDKEISTWLEPLATVHGTEDGRIHANYSVAGAASYRYSCSDPGLQAFPKLDIWEPHITADFSQAEYRLAALYTAQYTGDYALAEKYATGFDAHTITAMEIFKTDKVTKDQRAVGKRINFASNYGAGPGKVAFQMGITVQEAKKFLDLYQRNMRPTFMTASAVNRVWKERGYIKLWDGTRIWRKSDDPDYIGWNQLMQGGVAKVTARAMMLCDRHKVPMIGQVHDSIKFLADIDQEIAYDCMVSALPEAVSNWAKPPIPMLVDGFSFQEKQGG